MKASIGLARMMQQEQKAVEMMRDMRGELSSQGFEDNGLGEMVIVNPTPEKRAEIIETLRTITGAK